MTTFRALLLTLAFVAIPVAHAAESHTIAAAKLDQEHSRLAAMAGHWDVKQTIWPSKADAPLVDHGHARFSVILDGRHLQQDLHIDSAKPFDGLGYFGYDNATGKYFSTWMDINFPGMILADGQFDAKSNTYTFIGSMADADTKGGRIPLREVLRVVDADHFVYEIYEDHGKGEALAVKLEYARKG